MEGCLFERYQNVYGCYLLRNNVNNYLYIGKSFNLGYRILEHYIFMRDNEFYHDNDRLVKDAHHYGVMNFDFLVIGTVKIDTDEYFKIKNYYSYIESRKARLGEYEKCLIYYASLKYKLYNYQVYKPKDLSIIPQSAYKRLDKLVNESMDDRIARRKEGYSILPPSLDQWGMESFKLVGNEPLIQPYSQ
jgi:hypothetical protein